jgi:hypothetical protein
VGSGPCFTLAGLAAAITLAHGLNLKAISVTHELLHVLLYVVEEGSNVRHNARTQAKPRRLTGALMATHTQETGYCRPFIHSNCQWLSSGRPSDLSVIRAMQHHAPHAALYDWSLRSGRSGTPNASSLLALRQVSALHQNWPALLAEATWLQACLYVGRHA